jgi:hypothetical protein
MKNLAEGEWPAEESGGGHVQLYLRRIADTTAFLSNRNYAVADPALPQSDRYIAETSWNHRD